MDRKRFFYLLALLVIVAAVVVPAVLGNSRHTASAPATGGVAPGLQAGGQSGIGVQPGSQQEAAQTGSGTDAAGQASATQAPSSAAGSDEGPDPAATGTGAAPAPAAGAVQDAQGTSGLKVGIAVVGIGGEVLYPPASVTIDPGNKWGVTALGALDATGLPYSMKPAWPDFVDVIGGQACKGVSGWMYMINGEIPMRMGDKHPVKAGDRVIWWYSESMDQQPPAWDRLVAGKL
jgi:plastocyanin